MENEKLKNDLQVTFEKLVKQSKELHNLVEEKKATDAELLEELSNLHSTYHHNRRVK
jgi:peptidoglycan hydrolase CwlO-like protein